MEVSARPQEAEIPSLSYPDLALQFDSKLEEFLIGGGGLLNEGSLFAGGLIA